MGVPDTRSVELYRLAIEEGIRAIQHQESELARIRDRTITLVGLVATAASFLVGAALESTTRGARFFVPLATGTALFCVLLVLAWLLVKPVEGWKAKVSSTVIVDDFAKRESTDGFELLAGFYSNARDDNEGVLGPLRSRLQLAVGAAGLLIVNFMVLIWLVAS